MEFKLTDKLIDSWLSEIPLMEKTIKNQTLLPVTFRLSVSAILLVCKEALQEVKELRKQVSMLKEKTT